MCNWRTAAGTQPSCASSVHSVEYARSPARCSRCVSGFSLAHPPPHPPRAQMLEDSSQDEIDELDDKLSEAQAQVAELQKQVKQLQQQLAAASAAAASSQQ